MSKEKQRPRPVISVLMPVYNAAGYLGDAIDSILTQSYRDFELLIINDGSTDNSADLVEQKDDPRITLLHQPENLGLIEALNRGLEVAEGEFIARMDADDISLPQRFEKQVAFLNAHPEVGICGTWMEGFSQDSTAVWSTPLDHAAISARLLFESVLFHPTVMMRRALLEQYQLNYDPDCPHAEDYDLWCRSSRCFQLANIGEVLLRYRIHGESVGGRKRGEKLATASRVRSRHVESMGVKPTAEELSVHDALALWEIPIDRTFLGRAADWLLQLREANCRQNCFVEPVFSSMLAERLFYACEQLSSLGLDTLRLWTRSPLSGFYPVPALRRWRFRIRCLLRV